MIATDDVSSVFFEAEATRDVHAEIPEEVLSEEERKLDKSNSASVPKEEIFIMTENPPSDSPLLEYGKQTGVVDEEDTSPET